VRVPSRWQADVPLARLTTWRIGGPARFFSRPISTAELRDDLCLARALDLPFFVIGEGSNLLFPDRGYPGLIVRLAAPRAGRAPVARAATGEAMDGPTAIVELAAGSSFSAAARALAAAGWAGLEWAEGIPGTVAGAIVNNAGAYGGDVAQVLTEVDLLQADGQRATWPATEMRFAYRSSRLKGSEPTRWTLLAARWRLTRGAHEALLDRMAEIRARRTARTPTGASCGSVFRNPPGQAAGKLIASAGLAGTRRGDAQVATQHANYILNRGAARAEDALALMCAIRQRVAEEHGLTLEPEVQLVGFPPGVLDARA